MSWECPECGELNRDESIAICFCGFNRDELPDEPPATMSEVADKAKPAPGHTRKVFWKIFKFIFVVHFVAWSVVMVKQTVGRPYMLARAVMTNAVVLTGFYIRPLQKIVGPKNPLLTPLIGTRDFLFDIGWDLFPEDDADREFHWYAVYGNRELVLKSIHSYSKENQNNIFSDQEYEDYFYELNKHLSNFVTFPMRDKKNRAMRYFYFGVTAKRYRVMYGNYLAKKYGVDYYFEPDSEYIKNIRAHFNLFLQVRAKTETDSPKTYESFSSRTDEWWYPMQRYILSATNILIHEDVIFDRISCDNQLILEFMISREKILLYALGDSYTENAVHAKSYIPNAIYNSDHTFGIGTTFNLLKSKCNTPNIQAFAEYPQKLKEAAHVSN